MPENSHHLIGFAREDIFACAGAPDGRCRSPSSQVLISGQPMLLHSAHTPCGGRLVVSLLLESVTPTIGIHLRESRPNVAACKIKIGVQRVPRHPTSCCTASPGAAWPAGVLVRG
eukprot:EG_transcript_30573